jgi:small-conductance mechanosensitive channel
MNKPVRPDDDHARLPLSATVVIGGLALLGAISLIGWAISFLAGLVRFAIIVVVIVAAIAWIGGRRFGD